MMSAYSGARGALRLQPRLVVPQRTCIGASRL
jgi:hypothetical protein